MNTKKLICTLLFSSSIAFAQTTPKEKIEKECEPIIEEIRKELIDNLNNKQSPKKLADDLQRDITYFFDGDKYKNTFKYEDDREKIEIMQNFFKKQRKQNAENYKQTSKKTKEVVDTCLKNNPKKQNECLGLKKVFTYFYTWA